MTATEGLLDHSHWGLATWQPLRACKMTAIEGLQNDSHIGLSYPNISNEETSGAFIIAYSQPEWNKGPSTCSCLTPAWHILQIWSCMNGLLNISWFFFSILKKGCPEVKQRSSCPQPAFRLELYTVYSADSAVSSWQATWAHMSPIAGRACRIISPNVQAFQKKKAFEIPAMHNSRRSQCIHAATLGLPTMLASSYTSMCFVLILPSCRPPLTHLTF